MSKDNFYYVYLKTDSNNEKFETGITDDIVNVLLQQKKSSLKVAENDEANCWKLIYYEYGYNENSAQTRCDKIKKLAPSKRTVLIERHNPCWKDLSITWLRR